ncbi:hypothetical protein ACFUIW_08870 [Streptomyces sp. NPDC057245]|nr:hypothetical protein [Streptomyces sp. A108]
MGLSEADFVVAGAGITGNGEEIISLPFNWQCGRTLDFPRLFEHL